MPTAAPPPTEARLRAFHELYRGEFSFVWAAARRLGVPPAIVEDAVQDVFLTAYRRLDQLRFEVSARAWLHGVTRRVAARYRRTAARRDRRLAAIAAAPRGPAEPPHERVAAAQQLERALATLAARTRAAFEMAEILGMSGPEIASELGIPVATVYSRVRLAREQLLRELDAPQLERELATARERDTPPRETAQRAWVALLPALTPPGASVGLGALASARGWVLGTLLATGGVLAYAWPREPAAPATAPAIEASTSTAPAREPAAPEPAPEPALAPLPAATPAPAPTPRAPTRPAAEDPLAAEVAVLDQARAALARGALDDARARLSEHARRYPSGALADVRTATEIELLCRAGALDDAKARAVALVAAHPRSAVAQRFANFSCPR